MGLSDDGMKKNLKSRNNGKKVSPMGVHINEELNITHEGEPDLDIKVEEVFKQAIRALNDSGLRFAVGAAFARNIYTGIWRSTKDLDIFLKPADLHEVMSVLKKAGFRTSVENPVWLAKAYKGRHFVDLIFGTGHGKYRFDDRSFEGGPRVEVLDVETTLIPIEEMIVSNAYLASRQRFDGAEIAHLIHGVKGKLDWDRVVERLGEDRQLILWHLILFDYVYPGHKDYLPQALMVRMFNEIRQRWKKPVRRKKAFRGTLIDPFSFAVDIEDWGYEDRRNLEPLVDEEGKII